MNKPTVLAIFFSGLISLDVSAVSYHQLDKNKDGYISNEEAQDMPELAGQWLIVDSNQDGRIDRTEFALFEIKINEEVGYE